MRKRISTKRLKAKWEALHWPGLPPFSSDLNGPACQLMEQDTFIAGCISQIIKKGKLDEKFWPILRVDQNLTRQIANTQDPKTADFLAYKMQLDECIYVAQKILNLNPHELNNAILQQKSLSMNG